MIMRAGVVVFDDVDYGLDVASALHESGVSVILYLSYFHAAQYMGTADRPAERIHEVGLLPKECPVRLFLMPRIRDPRSLIMIDRLARTSSRDGVDVAHLLVGPGEFWVAGLSVRLRKIPVAATMIGTAARKEYSAATARLAPSSRPPMMVEVERENPGHRERH